jgi:drug/metabolite transporter (DMT)-like permease
MMRMVPAIVLLIAMSSLRRARGGEPSTKPTRPQMLALGAAALVGSCIGLVFYSVGMKYAKAGVATSISATYPIWVIPIAAIFLKETVNWRAAAFTVVAVAGIALLFL